MVKTENNLESNDSKAYNYALSITLFLTTASLFYPATRWLISQTLAHEQLFSPLAILGCAGILIIHENWKRLQLTFRLNSLCITLLLISYGLLALVFLFKITLLIFVSYCSAIAAGIIFIFGERVAKHTGLFMIAFALYVAYAVTLPYFDWPLRGLAGKNAAWILDILGSQVQLAVVKAQNGPSLIMHVDGRPFTVAPECNGFGVMSSSVLLGLLLIIYRKLPWSDKVLYVALVGLIAFFSNILRILIIILLAFRIDMKHYMLMHETVGIALFYATLAVVWRLSSEFTTIPRKS